ncbi:MAG: cytochrome c biogenesis protein CcdA, partial [bacterium]
MRKISSLALLLLTLIVASASRAASNPSSPFQLLWDDEPRKIAAGSAFHLTVSIRAPDGYYLYADETEVDFASLEGLFVTDIRYPKPTPYTDPYMGKTVKVYKGEVTISIDGRVPDGLEPGEKELTALVRYRGCSPTLCFRPEEQEISFRLKVEPLAAAERVQPKRPQIAAEEARPMPMSLPERLGLKGLLQVQDFSVLLERGTIFTIFIVLLAGILTSLTPCVWPVIPVVLLYVGVHPHKRFWENLLLSAVMVAGIVVTYAALGVGAVAFGRNLGFLFQQSWFLALVVLFFVAMSLSMFGVFDIRMPRRLHARLHRMGGEGYGGAFLAGMGLGLVASPCAGPVLAAILGYVALQGSYAMGFGLLIVYGIGMGILMMLLGACYGELAGKLRGGSWMLWIRRALGIVLLFPAAYYMGVLFNWSPL